MVEKGRSGIGIEMCHRHIYMYTHVDIAALAVILSVVHACLIASVMQTA